MTTSRTKPPCQNLPKTVPGHGCRIGKNGITLGYARLPALRDRDQTWTQPELSSTVSFWVASWCNICRYKYISIYKSMYIIYTHINTGTCQLSIILVGFGNPSVQINFLLLGDACGRRTADHKSCYGINVCSIWTTKKATNFKFIFNWMDIKRLCRNWNKCKTKVIIIID